MAQLPKITRCKFECASVTKRKNWNQKDFKFIYDYEFNVVTGGSDENESFFAYTPSGHLKIGAFRDDLFEPGKEYYLDFRVAPKEGNDA